MDGSGQKSRSYNFIRTTSITNDYAIIFTPESHIRLFSSPRSGLGGNIRTPANRPLIEPPPAMPTTAAFVTATETAATYAAAPLEPRREERDEATLAGRRAPPTNPVCPVLYLDSRYCVVSKPPDVRIDGPFRHTVANFVNAVLAAAPPLNASRNATRAHPGQTAAPKDRFVHRLDYATSGVLLLALTKPAAGLACAQFESRAVSKTYLALLHGRVAADTALVDAPVADTDGFAMCIGDAENPGRAARTRLEVVARGRYHGAVVTKVRLWPETGRRHQLRVHAHTLGHPVVGDATYAGHEEERWFAAAGSAGFVPPRMMLHAAKLEIQLPPQDAMVYGRKSARKLLQDCCFEDEDPFVPERLDGLQFEQRIPDALAMLAQHVN
jgi:23S rRNA-/tRNA-specific pseudouridylate synthase